MSVTVTGTCDQAVVVNQSQGEFLHYRVTVSGGNPQFAFGCAHRHILSAQNFPGHPMATYDWIYLRNPVDSDASDDSYGLSMLFIAATKYAVVIEHCDKTGKVIKRIGDVAYASTTPTDIARQSLEVFCV
jgi:hypothetical protein